MKTIAAVTMVFLPGTFVGTLLALPAFQWRSDGDLEVRRQFWIYWAITMPLTLITLLIWLAWSKWKAGEELKAEQEARDGINPNNLQPYRPRGLGSPMGGDTYSPRGFQPSSPRSLQPTHSINLQTLNPTTLESNNRSMESITSSHFEFTSRRNRRQF